MNYGQGISQSKTNGSGASTHTNRHRANGDNFGPQITRFDVPESPSPSLPHRAANEETTLTGLLTGLMGWAHLFQPPQHPPNAYFRPAPSMSHAPHADCFYTPGVSARQTAYQPDPSPFAHPTTLGRPHNAFHPGRDHATTHIFVAPPTAPQQVHHHHFHGYPNYHYDHDGAKDPVTTVHHPKMDQPIPPQEPSELIAEDVSSKAKLTFSLLKRMYLCSGHARIRRRRVDEIKRDHHDFMAPVGPEQIFTGTGEIHHRGDGHHHGHDTEHPHGSSDYRDGHHHDQKRPGQEKHKERDLSRRVHSPPRERRGRGARPSEDGNTDADESHDSGYESASHTQKHTHASHLPQARRDKRKADPRKGTRSRTPGFQSNCTSSFRS